MIVLVTGKERESVDDRSGFCGEKGQATSYASQWPAIVERFPRCNFASRINLVRLGWLGFQKTHYEIIPYKAGVSRSETVLLFLQPRDNQFTSILLI